MAQVGLLVSTLIGLLVIGAIVVLIGRDARGYSLPERIAPAEGPSPVTRAAHSPAVWTFAFILACLVFGGAALLFVGGASLPEGIRPAAGVVLAAGFGLVLLGYVFYGTFTSARARGLADSQAAALGSWIVGLLIVTVIAIRLLGLA